MKVYCKNDTPPFYKGNFYNIYTDIHSVFQEQDFISIKDHTDTKTTRLYRFRLNHSSEFIEGYIGENEQYFYDYFIDIIKERQNKLEQISKL